MYAESKQTVGERFIFSSQCLNSIGSRQLAQIIVVCFINDCFNIFVIRLGAMDSWSTILIVKGILFTVLYFCFCEGCNLVVKNDYELPVNERPIIGIVSQEQSQYLKKKYPKENFTSYIAASYVKDVESSGARVVPIMIGRERTYYKELLKKLNGVLFPGGATYFNQSNGYADAGQHILEIAKEMNTEGDYFPIFATCLGFELLVILESGRGYPENRARCYCFDSRPLHFAEDFRKSKLFKDAPDDVVDLLEHQNITVNAHQYCIVDENMKSHNLTADWRVTSHSDDVNGLSFIASMEHRRYPFYGVQFHPEKSSFEWKRSKNYPSSAKAIKVNRYFMDFFVSECRKSFHSFESEKEENGYVIYNYQPYFTGILGSEFHQCYMFEPRDTE